LVFSKSFLNGKGLLICSDASSNFADTGSLLPTILKRTRLRTNCSQAL
jgi:hypothetical protein